MANPLIRLEGIRKVFEGDEILTHALDGIHLTIDYGEYVAIRARRAAASRRCCRSSACSTPPRKASTGSTTGRSRASRWSSARATRNREIGFIFQSFNLIGDLSVYENVELPLTYMGMSRAERRKRVTRPSSASACRIARGTCRPAVRRPAAARRGGARGRDGEPSILLADEPTGNLDSHNGEAVMELLRGLHRDGATICMVTHDPRYAAHAGRAIHSTTDASFRSNWRPRPRGCAHRRRGVPR